MRRLDSILQALIIGTTLLVIMVPCTFAIVPGTINFQGYLTSPEGTPLDTTLNISFRIYSEAEGGSAIWAEEQSITIVDGLYNAVLGNVNSISQSFFEDGSTWLSIQLGEDAEMIPRVAFKTVPYAYRIGTVDEASGGTITSDVVIGGKLNAGSGNSNNGISSFVLGEDNNIVGGHSSIGGGAHNIVDDAYAVIGGGKYNRARGGFSVVAGGGGMSDADSNSASGMYSAITGGHANSAFGESSFIGGGYSNSAAFQIATIGGGYDNHAYNHGTTIGGGYSNFATAIGASVLGGGQNQARGQFATILGGGGLSLPDSNSAQGERSVIGGGYRNLTSNFCATVSGGGNNFARGEFSVIAGGGGDVASDSNSAQGNLSVIGGGYHNYATGDAACIAGGYYHTASGGSATIGGGYRNTSTSSYSTVGGGTYNDATGQYATIAGGRYNDVAGNRSSVGGGNLNQITPGSDYSTIAGGNKNLVEGNYSTIAGGDTNAVWGPSNYAAIGGGSINMITSGSTYSTIPGGFDNAVSGDYTFACGSNTNVSANNALVFGDGSETFSIGMSNTANFLVTNGMRVWTANPVSSNIGVRVVGGGTSWISLCDSTSKTNRTRVDGEEVLNKLSAMPIDKWNYKHQPDGPEHMGPMAQDFWSAFHLGTDSLGIETLDADGVLFAAVKELAKQNQEMKSEIVALCAQLQSQRAGDKQTELEAEK